MYEDIIAALMQDMQIDSAGARARALRDQPQPPPPPQPQPGPMGPPPQGGGAPAGMGPPGGATGSWGPPEATQPPPMPQMPGQRPPGPVPGPMLPKAMGVPSGPAGPSGPPPGMPAPIPEVPDPLEARQQDLLGQYGQAMQPPDRAPMEQAYQRRAQEGPRMLLHALAAERAGKGGLAKHFYGQAGEAGAPMRMAGGTMTPTGFIEDPGYAREFQLKKLEAQMAQNDRIIASNAVRKDKIAAEQRNADLRRELQENQLKATQAQTAQASRDRLFLGGLAHQDRQAAVGAKTEKTTEGERKAATLLQRLQFSEEQYRQAIKDNPAAAKPNAAIHALQKLPLAGEYAANLAMSPERQRVEAAQLDMLDAALTLGTGAAYTREQLLGTAKSYFPQPGDDDTAVADKKARLDNVIRAARIAAGSAGKQVPPGTPDVPAGPPGAGPLSPQESEELLLLRQRFKTRQ